MLKNMTLRRVALTSMLLFISFLFVLFPNSEESINLDGKEEIEYSNYHTTHEIFMVNKDNYVARTNVLLEEEELEGKVKGILEYLIIGGKKESSIPNGFRSIIPPGTSIKNRINTIKMEKAKELLANTNLKIYEIAMQLGLENTTYLSRLFHQYTGTTPMEYRNQNIKAP